MVQITRIGKKIGRKCFLEFLTPHHPHSGGTKNQNGKKIKVLQIDRIGEKIGRNIFLKMITPRPP